MGFRERNEKIPKGERAFILACLKKEHTDGEVPIRIRNFAKTKEEK